MPQVEEPTDFDLAIGLLSYSQVAAKLPFENAIAASHLPRKDDPVLLTKRLCARKSLPAKQALGVPGVAIDDLRKFILEGSATLFLRKGLGLPEERLLPFCAIEGQWFRSGDLGTAPGAVAGAVRKILESALPPAIDNGIGGFSVREDFPGSRDWLRLLNTPEDQTTVDFKIINPAYRELLAPVLQASPAYTSFLQGPAWMIPDFSGFKNAGEIALIYQLQQAAYTSANQRAQDQSLPLPLNSSNDMRDAIHALYSNNDMYSAITDEAVSAFSSTGFIATRTYAALGRPLSKTVTLRLTFADTMPIAQTDMMRLADLAF